MDFLSIKRTIAHSMAFPFRPVPFAYSAEVVSSTKLKALRKVTDKLRPLYLVSFGSERSRYELGCLSLSRIRQVCAVLQLSVLRTDPDFISSAAILTITFPRMVQVRQVSISFSRRG